MWVHEAVNGGVASYAVWQKCQGQMPHPSSFYVKWPFLRLSSVEKPLCNRNEAQLEFNNSFIPALCMDFPILQEKLPGGLA